MLWNICRYSTKMTICQALLQALFMKNEIPFGPVTSEWTLYAQNHFFVA